MGIAWRYVLRSVGSVLAGLGTAAAVQAALTEAWYWLLSRPSHVAHLITPAPPLAFLAVSSAAGAYVAARLAGGARLRHALAVPLCASVLAALAGFGDGAGALLFLLHVWAGGVAGGLLALPESAHARAGRRGA